jgi:hypothetical protein
MGRLPLVVLVATPILAAACATLIGFPDVPDIEDGGANDGSGESSGSSGGRESAAGSGGDSATTGSGSSSGSGGATSSGSSSGATSSGSSSGATSSGSSGGAAGAGEDCEPGCTTGQGCLDCGGVLSCEPSGSTCCVAQVCAPNTSCLMCRNDPAGICSSPGDTCVGDCPTTCPLGQFCCAQRTSAAPTTSCTAPADCLDGGSIQCFGPADCQRGEVCCGTSGSTQPLGTQCMAACAPGGALSRVVCMTPLDCPDSTYTCPASKPADSTAGLYNTCHPPVD